MLELLIKHEQLLNTENITEPQGSYFVMIPLLILILVMFILDKNNKNIMPIVLTIGIIVSTTAIYVLNDRSGKLTVRISDITDSLTLIKEEISSNPTEITLPELSELDLILNPRREMEISIGDSFYLVPKDELKSLIGKEGRQVKSYPLSEEEFYKVKELELEYLFSSTYKEMNK